jgi:hypothetical protein
MCNRTFRIKEIDGDTCFQHVTLEIKEKLILFLLFYIAEEYKGKYMISESAQTRLQNVKKSTWYDNKIYKAHCIPIQSVDEIITQIEAILKKNEDKNVFVHEMGMFSHAGGDGPISYLGNVKICPVDDEWPHQMDICGWQQINIKWTNNAKCVFYGCNTGNALGSYKNFAENLSNLSNFRDVEVWGQSTFSFPSFYPDKRFTTLARSIGENGMGWDVAETYQVAGNVGEGASALLSSIPVNPLNVYKNGKLIKSTHQGAFNDHR